MDGLWEFSDPQAGKVAIREYLMRRDGNTEAEHSGMDTPAPRPTASATEKPAQLPAEQQATIAPPPAVQQPLPAPVAATAHATPAPDVSSDNVATAAANPVPATSLPEMPVQQPPLTQQAVLPPVQQEPAAPVYNDAAIDTTTPVDQPQPPTASNATTLPAPDSRLLPDNGYVEKRQLVRKKCFTVQNGISASTVCSAM